MVIPVYAPTNRVPTNLPLYLLFWEFIVFDNQMSIKMLPHWALICMAVTTHGFEYLYIASFTVLSLFWEILACVLCSFLYCFVGLFLKICRALHTLCINPLLVTRAVGIFWSVAVLFILFMASFESRKFLVFLYPYLSACPPMLTLFAFCFPFFLSLS